MTSDDQQAAKDLLSAFSERPLESLEPATAAKRRERVVSSIQQILAEPASRSGFFAPSRFRWPSVGAGLALAAGLAIVVGQSLSRREGAAPVTLATQALSSQGEILCGQSDGKSWHSCDPTRETALSAVRTLAHAQVDLKTHVGARLALDSSSILLMGHDRANSPRSSRVTLTAGRVDVAVPKLSLGQQFAVETPTATVTVHGTAFTVTVGPDPRGRLRTCVELREGNVSVASKGQTERLVAPARWGCDSESEPETEQRSSTNALPARHAAPAQAQGANETVRRKTSLAQEIRLLQLALGAEQRKDFRSAEKNYRALLNLYPNSVVAPEARAALERLAERAPASK